MRILAVILLTLTLTAPLANATSALGPRAGVGPTMMLSGDLELGLSLTAGLNIPMRGSRRYNVEYRWGLGDIPDHKFGLAVMFGL